MARKKRLSDFEEEQDREYEEVNSEVESGEGEPEDMDAIDAAENRAEDEGSGYDERSARRIYRRKRRIRNQIIAYAVMLVFVALLACGAVYGGNQLIKYIDSNTEPDPIEELEEEEQTVFELTTPETTPEPEEELAYDPATEEVVDYYLSQMSTEEKVAGLFFVTPESMMEGVDQAVMAGGKTQEAMDAYKVGGIVYFAKNIQSADQITEMLAKTQEMSKYPLFFGVDEEGGSVARVADSISDITNIGDASALGATGDAGTAYTAYYQIGLYLERLGFNVNFAPVADIYNGTNALFATRSFGTDAETVSNFTFQAVYGLQDAGVSACAKHFPGHGNTDGDSHDGRATDESTEEELLASAIAPFELAMTAGTDFIMVGQMSLPNVVGDYTPATMSADIVTRILRQQLGYEGIIITDAMNMTSITDYYTSTEAAMNALSAGCDMILMPENFKEAYQGVVDAVNSGDITVERLEESLRRIYRVKCAGMTMADLGMESAFTGTDESAETEVTTQDAE